MTTPVSWWCGEHSLPTSFLLPVCNSQLVACSQPTGGGGALHGLLLPVSGKPLEVSSTELSVLHTNSYLACGCMTIYFTLWKQVFRSACHSVFTVVTTGHPPPPPPFNHVACSCVPGDDKVKMKPIAAETKPARSLANLPDLFLKSHFLLYGSFSEADRRLITRYVTAYAG